MSEVSGLLIVDKPSGITSHGVVGRLRRLLGTRRVGHAGTLDPMATGLLVVGVGRATRMLGYLAGHGKEYTATVRLGASTLTDDAEGEILALAPVDDLAAITDEAIGAGVGRLTGQLLQVPTAISAIKIDGQRSYSRVRAGEDVTLTPRPVVVSRFRIDGIRRQESSIDVDVDVQCTSGTYIRALARDLGADLGVGGYLTRLRRIRSGPWSLDDAVTLAELEAVDDARVRVLDLGTSAGRSFPAVTVGPDEQEWIRNGRPLRDLSSLADLRDVTAVLGPAGRLVALVGPREPERGGDGPRSLAVFEP